MKTALLLLPLFSVAVLTAPSKNSQDVNGFPSISSRIVGGQIAKPKEFPYQVLIKLPKITDGDISYDSWCGGSLISERVVLTAAHCLVDAASIVVYLGAYNRSAIEEPGRVEVPINKQRDTIVHETFDPELYVDDIALMILPERVELNGKFDIKKHEKVFMFPISDKINIISLPLLNQTNVVGRMAVTSGWGRTGDKAPLSDLLRFVQRKILRTEYCEHFYGSLEDSQICVDGYQRKSICQGDSGGPLVIEEKDGSKVLVGITSFGRSDGCERGNPSVFTQVSSYLDWIKEHSGITARM